MLYIEKYFLNPRIRYENCSLTLAYVGHCHLLSK